MKLLVMPEVAAILRVRKGRAYELAAGGAFPVVRLGRQVRVDEQALRAFVEAGGTALAKAQAELGASGRVEGRR